MPIDAVYAVEQEVPTDVSMLIPHVITLQEVIRVKKIIGTRELKLGTTMETVRGSLSVEWLPEEDDYFSIGTNELAQKVYSFSREDAEKKLFITFIEKGILKDNSFESVDFKGMGKLIQLGTE